MKKNIFEMAWNEPKDRKDDDHPNQNPDQKKGGMPELEDLMKDLKSKVLGTTSHKGNGGGNNSISKIPFTNGKFILVGIVALIGLWLLSGFFIVTEGQKAVVLFLGKEQAVKESGLRWRFPAPLGEYKILDVQRRFSQRIGNGSGAGAMMLTKDEAIVDIRVEVQYELDKVNPENYWFASIQPDETLRDVVESAMRERVGQTNLDDVLTSGRENLMKDVKALAQQVLDSYGIGLTITNVNLEDAQAPEPVQVAFSDAIRAREDEQRRKNQAEAYERQVVLEAEGEAAREVERAIAYKQSLIARAKGDAERFEKLNSAYVRAPEVTRDRLYLETLEQIFSNTNKVLLNTQSNNLMVLPLDQILKGANINGTTPPQSETTKVQSGSLFSNSVNNTSVEQKPSGSSVDDHGFKMRSRTDGRR